MEVDPRNPTTVYDASNGVFKSINGGASWNVVNEGLIDAERGALAVSAIAIDPSTSPSTVYLGTLDGMFVSRDEGATWSRFGLDGLFVTTLVLDRKDGVLHAETSGNSVFSRSVRSRGE